MIERRYGYTGVLSLDDMEWCKLNNVEVDLYNEPQKIEMNNRIYHYHGKTEINFILSDDDTDLMLKLKFGNELVLRSIHETVG